LLSRVLATRRATVRLCEPLGVEDLVAQSMPDASPAKWHLAHTTWFFERFVLAPLGIPAVRADADYLFNSYYESVGARHPRPKRGLLTRPTAAEIFDYRRAVDAKLADLAGSPRLGELAAALELGCQHEEQHQELLLTDIKHLFSENPLLPAYRAPAERAPAERAPAERAPAERAPAERAPAERAPAERPPIDAPDVSRPTCPLEWLSFPGGLSAIGHAGEGFAYDNERPRHKVHVEPFSLASRLVTAGEYLAFVLDGGYQRFDLWLSEGWSWVQANAQKGPMYWQLEGREAQVFTLRGLRPLRHDEPVCHVSYYEADAYARWAGARLASEAEWEIAVASARAPGGARDGAFADDPRLHPAPARPGGLAQALGDAWEWTTSAYAAYPGFRPLDGAFAEYNGKFMVSQIVLRGGSCLTPPGHVRPSYRNFYPPHAQWQVSGIRLARDT
jgi:formylglycine-generating enzyme required for sulfatase activity